MLDREIMQRLLGRKKMRGRPCGLTARLADRIYFLARKGQTDAQIAWVLDISRTTLHDWKRGSGMFRAKLAEAKAEADLEVEKALFQRARGLTVTESRTVRIINGNVAEVTVERELPPDSHVCMMWLQNRRPDRWGRNARSTPSEQLKEWSLSPMPVIAVSNRARQISEAVMKILKEEQKEAANA